MSQLHVKKLSHKIISKTELLSFRYFSYITKYNSIRNIYLSWWQEYKRIRFFFCLLSPNNIPHHNRLTVCHVPPNLHRNIHIYRRLYEPEISTRAVSLFYQLKKYTVQTFTSQKTERRRFVIREITEKERSLCSNPLSQTGILCGCEAGKRWMLFRITFL